VVYPALHFPDITMTLTVVVLFAGFPVALALGWVFDLTPQGVKRTEPEPEEHSDPAPAVPGRPQPRVVSRVERLDMLLAREGLLPLGRAVDITEQIAEMLRAAHRQGLAHGQIQPTTVLLAQDPQGGELVKLLDKPLPPEMVGSTHLEYASPEEIVGDPLGPYSDVYTLGLLLFRMLTGSLPHRVSTPDRLPVERLTRPPLSLRAVLPGRRYPDALQRVLDRALTVRPSGRQPDASAFQRELVQAVSGERGYTRVMARVVLPGTRDGPPPPAPSGALSGPVFAANASAAIRAGLPPGSAATRPGTAHPLPRARVALLVVTTLLLAAAAAYVSLLLVPGSGAHAAPGAASPAAMSVTGGARPPADSSLQSAAR
jgi:hypothetical protein